MSRCPACKYAKCRWIEVPADLKKISTERLRTIQHHNIAYIEMIYRGNQESAHAEERAYARLLPIQNELERRGES